MSKPKIIVKKINKVEKDSLELQAKKNTNLNTAKKAKYDEFYTQITDVEQELNYFLDYNPDLFKGKKILLPCDDPEWSSFFIWFAQNFTRIGAKQIIGTSYNPAGFGKMYILEKDFNQDGKIDRNDFEIQQMKGNGDFRSQEVKELLDKTDFVITNPPFSLIREFIQWVNEADKKFLIIGNESVPTYKEIFPLIQDKKLWCGKGSPKKFQVPDNYSGNKYFIENNKKYVKLGFCLWFTNIDHGIRNQPLSLMTKAQNKKYHSHISKIGYLKYDNFNAIEVCRVNAIPSDHNGIMGVPVSFLKNYCPDQFELVGNEITLKIPKNRVYLNGKRLYARLFIRHKKNK